MSLAFDPFAPPDDPYPIYRRLRDEAPVHHSPEREMWSVTRYDDVMQVLKLEARIALEALVPELPRLARADPHVARVDSFLVRGPKQLRLRPAA